MPSTDAEKAYARAYYVKFPWDRESPLLLHPSCRLPIFRKFRHVHIWGKWGKWGNCSHPGTTLSQVW